MSTPANVNGKLVLPDGGAPPAGSYAQVDLKNIGTALPTVDGFAIYNQKQFSISTVDGTWSGTLYRNDNISINGTFPSVWALTYFANGRAVYPAKLVSVAQATADLDSLVALNLGTTPTPPVQPLTGGQSALATFAVAASTWTCVHNFNTQAIVVQCYDSNWNQIIPDSITSTSLTTATVTFLQPQAGFMVVFNVGNWTPSVSNPNYIIGNPTSSQGITGDYPFTLGGSLSAKRIEGVRYADQFAGGDIGAKINAAYADLPSTGGRIRLASGNYSFSTPINFNTANKYVVLEGDPSIGSSLVFTASSGAAITFNDGNGGLPTGHGLRDIKLMTTVGGTSAVGLLVGGTQGACGLYVLNAQVQGFAVQLQLGSNVQSAVFEHCVFNEGAQGFVYPSGLSFSGEQIVFRDCMFANTTAWTPNYLSIAPSAANNATVYFFGCHMDNCGYVQSGGDVNFFGLHMENNTNTVISASYYLSFTGGSAKLSGFSCVSQQTNVPAGFVSITGGASVCADGIDFQNTGASIIGFNVASGCTLNLGGLKALVGSFQYLVQSASASVSRLDHLSLQLGALASLVYNSGQTTAGVTGTAFGLLNPGVAWFGQVDINGNMGLAGYMSAANGAKLGTGTLLARYARYTPTLSPSSIAANTTAEQTFTGVLTSGDIVVGVSKPTAQAGLGIVGWRASGTSLLITFANNTASPITPTASEVYQIIAVQ